jgi:hypothetical protein
MRRVGRVISAMPFGPSRQMMLLATTYAVVVKRAPLVAGVFVVAVRTTPLLSIRSVARRLGSKPTNASQYQYYKKDKSHMILIINSALDQINCCAACQHQTHCQSLCQNGSYRKNHLCHSSTVLIVQRYGAILTVLVKTIKNV